MPLESKSRLLGPYRTGFSDPMARPCETVRSPGWSSGRCRPCRALLCEGLSRAGSSQRSNRAAARRRRGTANRGRIGLRHWRSRTRRSAPLRPSFPFCRFPYSPCRLFLRARHMDRSNTRTADRLDRRGLGPFRPRCPVGVRSVRRCGLRDRLQRLTWGRGSWPPGPASAHPSPS